MDEIADRYDAFVSYSHSADSRLAPALQSGLERIGRPWWRLRALRIFRDQTNLSVRPDLWSAIEGALAGSEWFVLLASPKAAASKWVHREVAWWLKHRSADRLLIVLTEGELAWSEAISAFDSGCSSALPAPLLKAWAREPLHVDLRWATGGADTNWASLRWRSALLDVAATIHGRSKDEMDGEAVRALRRNRTWAAAAALALSATTIVAMVARQRALDEALRSAVIAQARLASALAATRRQADALPLAADAAARALTSLAEVPRPVLGALRDALESSRVTRRWDAGPQVFDVLYDGDGSLLTLQRDGHVRRWDAEDREVDVVLLAGPEQTSSEPPALLPSPSRAAIVARLDDQRWRIWSLTGQPLLQGRVIEAQALDVSAGSGAAYAVDKRRKLLRLGSIAAEDRVLKAALPANARRLLADPQDRWLVVVYEDDGIDLVELPTGRRTALGYFCAEGGGLFAGGSRLMVAGCGRLAEIPLPAGEIQRTSHGALALIEGMVVRDDGSFAVSHKQDDRVHVFTRHGAPLLPAQLGVSTPSMAFSPDGRELAVAGYIDAHVSRIDLRGRSSVYPYAGSPAGTASGLDACRDRAEVFWSNLEGGLYSFEPDRPHTGVRTWQREGESIEAVHCLPGAGAVTERRDHAIEVWTAPGQNFRLREANKESLEGMTVSQQGPVVVALADASIQRWSRTPSGNWRRLPDLPLPQPQRGWRAMQVDDQQGKLVLGSYNGDILVLDLADGNTRFGPRQEFDSNTWVLAVDRGGAGFAAGGAGTPLAFFDWQGQRRGSLQTDRFMFVSSIAYDRGLVLMPSSAGELPLKDTDGTDIGPPIRPASTSAITPMQFAAGGRLITADLEVGIGIHEMDPRRLLLIACRLLQDRQLRADATQPSMLKSALQGCATHHGRGPARQSAASNPPLP